MNLPRLPVVPYLYALAATAMVLALQTVAGSFFARSPYLLALLAAVATGLFVGRGPGLLAVLLSGIGLQFVRGSRQPVDFHDPEDVGLVALVVLTGFAMVELAARARAARGSAEASAQHLSAVFASITDGFAGLDRSLRFTFANSEAERLFGRDDDLLGAHVSDVLGPDAAAPLDSALRQGAHCTIRREGAGGRRLEIRAHPSPQGLALYVTDRTEQERGEWAATFLAEAGEILGSSLDYEKTLQDMARLAVPRFADYCLVDTMDGGVVRRVAIAHVDPEKQRQLESFEMVPRQLGSPILRAFSGETLLVPLMDDAWLDKAALTPEHRRLLTLTRPRSAMLLPLRAQGRVLGVLTFCFSETTRRYTAADLPLAEEIARRAAIALDNARLYREANRAIRLREEFLSIASHELKTPLTSMRMQVQLFGRAQARAGEAGLPAAEIAARIGNVERQLDRLGRLIDRLLDVTRIDAGHLHLEPEEADLSALAREVAERFGGKGGLQEGAIVVNAAQPVQGHWDRFRLEQVLTNLVDNALKYGGGRPVELRVEGEENRALVHVRDAGAGIPAAQQGRLFERFEQLDPRRSSGLGLGLYISRRIVQAHGGAIRVQSGEGDGTTFTVELPRV